MRLIQLLIKKIKIKPEREDNLTKIRLLDLISDLIFVLYKNSKYK